MNTFQQIFNQAKNKFKETALGVMNSIDHHLHHLDEEKFNVHEIAAFILNNPSSSQTKNRYLNLDFHHFSLKADDLTYEMLLKGTNKAKLLELTIYSKNKTLYEYKSYNIDKGKEAYVSLPVMT